MGAFDTFNVLSRREFPPPENLEAGAVTGGTPER